MAFKILHFADVHLDISFAGMGFPVDVARQYRQALREALKRLIDIALHENVAAVTVGGDLYEQERFTADTGNFLAEQFARLGAIPVFMAPGNHDPLVPDSLYRQTKWPENVTIFPHPKLEPIPLSEDIVLWGLAHPSPSWREAPLKKFRVPDDRIHILLLHGSDMSSVPSNKVTHAPFVPEEIGRAGFSFALLGHYHQGRLSPEENPILAYPGSPEPLAFCESGLHGAVLLEIETGGLSARHISTSTYQSVQKNVAVSELSNRDAILAKIHEELREHAGPKVLARVILEGTRHPDVAWDLAVLRENLPENFLHVFLEDHTLPAFPLDELREEKTVRGEFVRRLLSEMESASDEQKTLIKDALTFGLLAFEKKEIVTD
ncbi:MAG: hypothetical protein GXO76_08710 [Calditrichaeota bacterium]|nr:hypothetical protein [Calditrichota bacterium]